MAGQAGTIVYNSKPTPKRRIRRNGAVASVFVGPTGSLHTQINVRGASREWVTCLQYAYVNCDFPRDKHGKPIGHPDDSYCPTCKNGYSHMIESEQQKCDECRVEHAGERARKLEEAGIPMGWGYTRKSCSYEHDVAGTDGGRKRQINEYWDASAYWGQDELSDEEKRWLAENGM